MVRYVSVVRTCVHCNHTHVCMQQCIFDVNTRDSISQPCAYMLK
jgi:hypothetical protein